VGCNLIDLIERRLNLGKTDGRVWGSGDCCGGGYLCGTRLSLDLDDWAVLIHAITTARKEREAVLLPACPDDCQLGSADRQADRTHGDVEAAC
jgi:hypothetical protein